MLHVRGEFLSPSTKFILSEAEGLRANGINQAFLNLISLDLIPRCLQRSSIVGSALAVPVRLKPNLYNKRSGCITRPGLSMYLIQLYALLLILLLGGLSSSYSCADEKIGKRSLGVVIGYGASHPGWGDTVEKIETIDLALRYESAPEKIKGRNWYRNRRSFVIEVPLHLVRNPYDSFMLGVSFLSRWTFEGENIKPYFLIGGGPVYSNANIEGMSSKLNGSYQTGVGLEFSINQRRYFVDIRYHHVSNGGISEPNIPLNSSKILFGVELY